SEERSLNNNSFLGEYECSSLALDREERRDEKKRLDHLKQDQTMLVIKRFSERKKVFRERKKTGKIRAKRYVFLPRIVQYLYTGFPTASWRQSRRSQIYLRAATRLRSCFCLFVEKVVSGIEASILGGKPDSNFII
ncbi:hypothetical protein Tco_1559371, partial [Tanacetum coccineum]